MDVTSANVIAWNAVDGLLRLLGGEEVPSDYPIANRLFTQDTAKTLQLDADGAASFDWFGSPTFQDDYAALWGVN